MTRCANEVEAISRETQIKGSYQRAGREFGCHEHVAKNADALPGNHCLDCTAGRRCGVLASFDPQWPGLKMRVAKFGLRPVAG